MFGTLQNMYRITIPSLFLSKRRSREKEEEKEEKGKGKEKAREKKRTQKKEKNREGKKRRGKGGESVSETWLNQTFHKVLSSIKRAYAFPFSSCPPSSADFEIEFHKIQKIHRKAKSRDADLSLFLENNKKTYY